MNIRKNISLRNNTTIPITTIIEVEAEDEEEAEAIIKMNISQEDR